MVVTPHMTRAHSPAEAAQHEASTAGMAHFAGTGPVGKRCFHCQHWNNGSLLTIGRNLLGDLLPAPCGMFAKLSGLAGLTGPAVPALNLCCRHFEQSEAPPDLTVAPEPKKKKAP